MAAENDSLSTSDVMATCLPDPSRSVALGQMLILSARSFPGSSHKRANGIFDWAHQYRNGTLAWESTCAVRLPMRQAANVEGGAFRKPFEVVLFYDQRGQTVGVGVGFAAVLWINDKKV